MGSTGVKSEQPAFYGSVGSRVGDLITVLHPPYTLWHLSYVVIGAALASHIDGVILAGTVLAFFLGLGVGAHALDEFHDRPLGTGLPKTWLLSMAVVGLGGAAVLAVIASVLISPVAALWGVVGLVLAIGYTLEIIPGLHSVAGFALSWGSFPVLVGYWAQTESMTIGALLVAAAAAFTSAAQRLLSTPARRFRRNPTPDYNPRTPSGIDDRPLLTTWESPLRALTAAHVLFAAGLLALHL